MNIEHLLQEHARERGSQEAIVDRRGSLTFAQLDAAADRAAADLAAAGLRSGDRALVFCPMSANLYVTVIAMFRLGVTAVFLDPGAGRAHIEACCARAQPRGFVAIPRAHLLRFVSRAIRRLPLKIVIGRRIPGMPSVGARCPRASAAAGLPTSGGSETQPSAPALITFTSGSTGVPKAIVRTHEFLLTQHRVLAEDLELRAGEVDLATLPVFVLANLASGLTSVIPDTPLHSPGDIDAARLLQQIRFRRPTRIAASPALLGRLARRVQRDGDHLDIARIFTGGGPVFPVLLDALASAAPRATISAVYGSTEAEPIARLDARDVHAEDRVAMRGGKGLLLGRPIHAIGVRIVADCWGRLGALAPEEFGRRALPAESSGEIVVSGPHVLRGYLDGAGDEETKIRVGDRVWHRTGDAGYFDASGRLWLLGRCSARVTDAHGTIYPLAVEAAASEIDGVGRTAFAAHGGRRILVVELARPHKTSAAALKRELAWAHLDEVIAVDRVPVDTRHNAKIDYRALEAMLRRCR